MPTGSGFVLREDDPLEFATWIRHRCRIGGDRMAIEIAGEQRSYAALDDVTDRCAAGLADLGLEPGEHVSLMMLNSLRNIDAWFGIQKAGLVEVPIHTAARGTGLQYIVDHADARAMVIDEGFLPYLATVADQLPRLEHVIVHADGSGNAGIDLPSRMVRHDLEDIVAASGPPPAVRLDRKQTAVILHTSGTTGPPKGVVLSHQAVLHLTRHLVWLMEYTSDDRLYTAFPLFHNNAKYTSVCAALEAGGSVVLDQRFSVSRFWPTIREKEITAFNYMGALLMMLNKQEERPDDADNPVRIAFGAPCPVEIWEDFERRFGMKLVEVYGMTECPMSTENRLDNRRIGSAGKASMTYDVRIVDENDDFCGADEPGEIVVRPRMAGALFTEYYKRSDATVESWRNLWFHTGDRGRMDAEGFLYFIDRMKDCIRRRGENISSWEVESTINTHQAVLECAAYGVPSPLTEYEVAIAVTFHPGQHVDPVELLDYCDGRLPHFAIPRYVRIMDELPKNHAQRVQKYMLRDDGVTTDTWDRESVGYEVRR
jgi:crotonobetaine/carnitine-CoA ligase